MAADLQQSEILQKHIEEPVNDGHLQENGENVTETATENDLGINDKPNDDENEAVSLTEAPAEEGNEMGMDLQDHVGNIGEVEDKCCNDGENGLNENDESTLADAVEEKSGISTEKSENVTGTADDQMKSSEEVSDLINQEGKEHDKQCDLKDEDMLEETVNHLDSEKEGSGIEDDNLIEEENSSDDKLNEVETLGDSQNDSSGAAIDEQLCDLPPVGAEDERPSSAVQKEEEIEKEETELEKDNEELEMINEEQIENQKHEEGSLVEKVDEEISLEADSAQDSNNDSEKLSEVTSEVLQDDSGDPEDAKKDSDETGGSVLERSSIENDLESNVFTEETADDLKNEIDLEQVETNSSSSLIEDKTEDLESVSKEVNSTEVDLVEDENKDCAYNEEIESFKTDNIEVDPNNDMEEIEFMEGNNALVDGRSQSDIVQDSQESEMVDDIEEKQEIEIANGEAANDSLEGDSVVNDADTGVLEGNEMVENEGGKESADILCEKKDTDQKMDTDQLDTSMGTDQKMDTDQTDNSITEVVSKVDKDSNEVDMVSEGITQNTSEGSPNDVAKDNEDENCEVDPKHQPADRENVENQDALGSPVTNQESETSNKEQNLPETNQEAAFNHEEQLATTVDQGIETRDGEQPEPDNNKEIGTKQEEQPISDQEMGTNHEEQTVSGSDRSDQETETNDTEQSIHGTSQDKVTNLEEQSVDDTTIKGSELETVVSDTSAIKETNESESPMEVDENKDHDESVSAAEDKANQDSEAMEIIEDSRTDVKASSEDTDTEKLKESEDTDNEKFKESGSTVDEQNSIVPTVSEELKAIVEGSQIKEETEADDIMELKIVGVTSAVGKEDETQVKPQEVALKIDSVQGADQTKPETEEVIPKDTKDTKVEDTKPVVVKTENKTETTKAEKGVQNENVTKKEEEDDDVIAVKEEKKPPPPPPPKPKTSKIQKCIVCSKVGKCKYNIVRNGDVKHLCDDTCFKEFRSNPTAFLKQAENDKSKAESAPKNGTQPTTAAVSKKPDTQQAPVNNLKTKSASEIHQGAPYKTCTVCQLMNLKTSKPFLSWQGLDYCGEDCLGKFQASLSVTCGYCSSQIHQSNKAKFCCRVGEDVKHFCSRTCSAEFVKRIKACAFCNKDLAKSNDSFMAPVGNQGMFKDFCSQNCLMKYEDINGKETEVTGDSGQGGKAGNFACSVCSKVGPVKHEVKFDNKIHQLCSDPCFSAFQYANKLTLNTCDNCGTSCFNDSQAPHYIQFEGKQKRFCSFMCVNSFRNQKKKPTPCAWCGTKKSNFDMIERVDSNNRFQLFCSLNCLSLYRVNLQATSNQAIVCDQCSKYVPAQYHLTMSDASVRNFCSYGCVMQFQTQFQTPTNQKTVNQPSKQTQSTSTQQQVTTTRSGRVVTRGTKQQQWVDQQQQQQQRKEQAARVNKANQDSVPIISNVVSLAPKGNQQQINIRSPASVTVTDQQSGKSITTTTTGNQTVQQQIIIQPPPPKSVKNKSMWCKPLVQTKATACRPHTQTKEIQTEGKAQPDKVFVPVPVPIYCPTPLSMYSVPTPVLVPVPVPVPVPVFIPTTKKSSASILKQIKEIQEKIPADPLEAELLMMAEAVAGKGEDSSSDSDEGETEAPATKEVPTGTTGGELGEDMLQMALRMASEMSDEPVMDLETSLEPVAVNTDPPPPPPPVEKEVEPEEDEEYVPTTRSKRGRGSAKRSSRATPRRNPKRQKTETPPQPQYREPTPSPPPVQAPPPDANFHLKYTYGVNAFKHWVTQKNAQLEQAMKPGNTRQLKTFKTDILQCTADELNYALCLFVKEVRKPNGEEYAVDSIYYLCLGIQQYLFESGRIDNVFTDMYYERFTECLNELLCRYEPKLNQAGQLVCRIEEEHLWESKQLGAHSPHVLLNTLVYFNTKYFMLKTSEDHLKLSFTHIMKHWKKTANGRGSGVGVNQGRSVYLRYYCPTPQTRENPQKKKKEEMPVYEQTENLDNPLRCPVKLYEFYLSKCPESIKNRNDTFYLIPERSCVPDSPVWYSTTMLGIDAMAKMLNRIRLVREIQEAHLHTQPIYI